MIEQLTLTSKYDQKPIYTTLYTIDNPKGIVQVIHGMKEHQNRYQDFAKFLNEQGFIVMTSDFRGHGKNALLLGHMVGKEPWKALVIDQVTIAEELKARYPNLKLYLFAHSMGTIVSRNLIQKHAHFYEKVILSGVPAYQKATLLGILTANCIGFFRGNAYVSKLLTRLTDDQFSKAIKNAKTPVDWLSFNEDNVSNYLMDPYCNIPFSVSAYKALYHLVWGMHQKKRYQVTNPMLPLLLLVGRQDPCPLGEKGLTDSIETLQKAGYKNVSYKVYDGMRHEILNEKNHEIVYEDILNFLNK